MSAQVDRLAEILIEGRELNRFGSLLHDAWELKAGLTGGISNPEVDRLYREARQAGALGGKLLGAGGGGFLLMYVEPQRQQDVRRALPLRELDFGFEPQGSKIIYVHR